MRAAARGDVATTSLLLRAGADPNREVFGGEQGVVGSTG
jgi:hypothetical protein